MTTLDLSRAVWRKSSRSLNGSNDQCIEVAAAGGRMIAARDSKDPDGPVLRFTPREWASFLTNIKTTATPPA